MARVLTAQTTNTTAAATGVSNGALHSVFASGTFDGATVKVQFSPDGGTTMFDDPDAALQLTAQGMKNFEVPAGVAVFIDVSGAGASTSLNVDLF